jgi:hypothetical protein
MITVPGKHVRLMAHYTARWIMNTYIETIVLDATLTKAATRILENRNASLPDDDANEMVNLIAETDIRRACVVATDDPVSGLARRRANSHRHLPFLVSPYLSPNLS